LNEYQSLPSTDRKMTISPALFYADKSIGY